MTTKLQFKGFINTPNLWQGNAIFGMDQLELPKMQAEFHNKDLNPKLRLGKLVENFVFEVLNQSESTIIIAENIQIRKEKISIGEIDCILQLSNKIIHLEIVYKFYLYDENIKGNELKKWIGPNRKDDLIYKLTKLKDKQLPILYKKETKDELHHLKLDYKNILQKVVFKAQLFVPRSKLSNTFNSVNNDCIVGFYINYSCLEDLKHNEFFIPKKRDWLTEPQIGIEWLSYSQFDGEVKTFIKEQRSPMCWLKNQKNILQKFFVVWWK